MIALPAVLRIVSHDDAGVAAHRAARGGIDGLIRDAGVDGGDLAIDPGLCGVPVDPRAAGRCRECAGKHDRPRY